MLAKVPTGPGAEQGTASRRNVAISGPEKQAGSTAQWMGYFIRRTLTERYPDYVQADWVFELQASCALRP